MPAIDGFYKMSRSSLTQNSKILFAVNNPEKIRFTVRSSIELIV